MIRAEHSPYVRSDHGDVLALMSRSAGRVPIPASPRYLGFVGAFGRTDALVFDAGCLLFFATFFFTLVEPVATRLE